MEQRTLELSKSDFQLPKDLRAIIVGPSQAGKTSLILDWLLRKADMFPGSFYQHIIFASPNLNESLMSSKDRRFKKDLEVAASPASISFYDHLITSEELLSEMTSLQAYQVDGEVEAQQEEPSLLLILDDFTLSVYQDQTVAALFTRLGSHSNVSTIICVHQGLSSSSKHFAMVWSSASFFVFFRNACDRLSMTYISRKMFPYAPGFLVKCMDTAVDLCGPYEPLVLNCAISNRLNHQFPVCTNHLERHDLPRLYFRSPYQETTVKNAFPL